MAIKPNRNTNYPYLNESDQDALEDIGSQDPVRDAYTFVEILIGLCFDRFIKEGIEIREYRKRNILENKAQYKRLISTAYKEYFECIITGNIGRFGQLPPPLSNPNRPSIAECKKERDKLIKYAEERYAEEQKKVETRTTEDEIENYNKLRSCIKSAQDPIA
jgi:hypothetical protein